MTAEKKHGIDGVAFLFSIVWRRFEICMLVSSMWVNMCVCVCVHIFCSGLIQFLVISRKYFYVYNLELNANTDNHMQNWPLIFLLLSLFAFCLTHSSIYKTNQTYLKSLITYTNFRLPLSICYLVFNFGTPSFSLCVSVTSMFILHCLWHRLALYII